MQKSNITRTAEIIMGRQKNGEMSGHIIYTDTFSSSWRSCIDDKEPRQKNEEASKLPGHNPKLWSLLALPAKPISLVVLPTFLRAESLKTRKLETWGQVFCSWKASRTRLNISSPPPPHLPRCNLTTIPTLAVKGRTNSRHFGHQDFDPSLHDFLRYLIVQHPDLFRRIENHSLALLPKTELTK